jgi:hypothetical protein
MRPTGASSRWSRPAPRANPNASALIAPSAITGSPT